MDPFELLKKDHKTVSELFEKIEAASGKAKLFVFKQLKSELDLHARIEETILYPSLEKANQTRDLTLEAYEEHKVVKDLLGQLATAKTATDEWQAKLKVLRENVEHHVEEEEGELFDKANDLLTGEEAEELGNRMQAEKVKQGGSAAAPDRTDEKPGLIKKIASALGLGGSPARAGKKSTKKVGKTAGNAASSSAKSTGPKTAKKKAGAARKSTSPSKSSSRKSAGPKSARKTAARKSGSKSTPKRATPQKSKRRS